MKKIRNLLAAVLLLAVALSLAACGKEENLKFTPGTIEDGVYTNTYLGIRFEGKGWNFASPDEIRESVSRSDRIGSSTIVGETAKDVEKVGDLMASSTDGTRVAQVVFDGMRLKGGERHLTNESVLDEFFDNLDLQAISMEQMGIRSPSFSRVRVTYRGEEWEAMKMRAFTGEEPVYVLQIYDYDHEGYGAIVSVSTVGTDTTEQLMAMFQKYEAE